nr:uncharacterized protein LOC127315456 [Lolium perenne]
MNLQDKGKGIQIESAHEGDDAKDRSDSDYENVHEADSGDSSANDDEAIFYRKYVEELKESVRRQILGEDMAKVKEEFIVPENIKEQEEGSECFDTDDDLSFDEDSDGEVRTRKTKHRVYDESAQVKEFEVGQSFTDSRQFKQELINYGLKEHHHLTFPKDERTRVLAECKRRNNKLVTSAVIAEKYFREIKDNPGWRIHKMQEVVLEDLLADVSESKCKRAKKIMDMLIDNTTGEYDRVFEYHMELVRSNPGSTVAVTLNPDVTDKPVFERMYVCLEGCKRGFLVGCRRVVGLDGYFLKGPFTGQILSAVGRDPNNQMYPIAWATIEGENYDSWYWFLSLLQKDIQINNQGDGWVIISDQQKGLIKAVNEIIPNAELRMCARHIYANWRKEHRDKVLQKKCFGLVLNPVTRYIQLQ